LIWGRALFLSMAQHSFSPSVDPDDQPRRCLLKVILLGDSGVGKTSLMESYLLSNYFFFFNIPQVQLIAFFFFQQFLTYLWGVRHGSHQQRDHSPSHKQKLIVGRMELDLQLDTYTIDLLHSTRQQ